MKGISIFKSAGFWPVMVAVVVSVFFVVATVQATTTISTDITTGGALTVTTGDTSLQHASTTQLSNSGVAWFTGDTTLGHASTTQLTSSGTVWVTTSDSATSTVSLGCIQTTATSTLTPIKLSIGAASTTAGTTFGAAADGFVTWTYGTCP